MMLSWPISLLIIFAGLSSLVAAADPCRFKDTEKGVIDLRSLGRTDGQAAYLDVIPQLPSNYKYSYNSCKPFTEGSACVNVAACQISNDGAVTFSLGNQSTAQWDSGANTSTLPSVSYSYNQKRTIVELQCSPTDTSLFEAVGQTQFAVYRFRLTHKCACWNGCGAGPPQKNCSINGSVYTSDKQVIQSFPFDVSINPPLPQPSPPTSSYAVVDLKGYVIELILINIQSVPLALFCLSQVKALSFLNSTSLSIPPEIIGLASSLTSFTVSNISSSLILPPEFFQLRLLSTLSIVNCGLETLSEDIIKLDKLTQLTLDYNQLVTLPTILGKLSSLTSLSINNNSRLSSLDALDGSTSLITLQGSTCVIDHLPTNISNLGTIEMNGNRLTSLDGIETDISESCNLLSFANNQITSISSTSLENIQTLLHLDLSNNLLTTLPESLYQINDLQTLDIR